MLHLQQLPSRVSNKTQTGKEGANQRQPYFLLMVVLGADTGKNFLGVQFLDINILEWPSPFC